METARETVIKSERMAHSLPSTINDERAVYQQEQTRFRSRSPEPVTNVQSRHQDPHWTRLHDKHSQSSDGVHPNPMNIERQTADSSSQYDGPSTSLVPQQTLEKISCDKVPAERANLVASDSSAPVPKPRSLLSSAQRTNVRYQRDGSPPRPDHPNEDRIVMKHVDTMRLLAVLDGHDGDNAVRFAVDYLEDQGLSELLLGLTSPDCDTDKLLTNLFQIMDRAFFNSIKQHTSRKKIIQRMIENCKSSYDAYLKYPGEISELQQVEELISGGTTVVLAVIFNNRLHVGNVGDSRALIVREIPGGALDIEQLSIDHGVDNVNELDRLEATGLNREQMKKSGRLGSQENTRSIGDYCLKGGYEDVDALSTAKYQPGISIPSVISVEIDKSFKYLLLMSDGVYKSIEALEYPPDPAKTGRTICDMLKVAVTNNQRDFQKVAESFLEKIASAHERTHYESDPRSELAVQCRKRDDMSLVVYQFKQV